MPDLHPEISRTLIELGRVAHAEGRLKEALGLYRAGLARLERALREEHAESLTAKNNLATLLADMGASDEARVLWTEALALSRGKVMRPAIRSTIEANLARFVRGEHSFKTLPTFSLSIGEPEESEIFKGEPLPILPHGIVRFHDDFEGKEIDFSKWEYGGSLVTQIPGELRVERTVTDSGGWARTKPIRIDPTLPLVVRRRVKIDRGNHKAGQSMEVEITGYPHRRFGVGYADFIETPENHILGFLLSRMDANPMSAVDRLTNTSGFTTPVWGKWFDEELLYDTRSGMMRYSIDGKERLNLNAGRMPPGAETVTILFTTWGWYTGNYQHMKRVEVGQ